MAYNGDPPQQIPTQAQTLGGNIGGWYPYYPYWGGYCQCNICPLCGKPRLPNYTVTTTAGLGAQCDAQVARAKEKK